MQIHVKGMLNMDVIEINKQESSQINSIDYDLAQIQLSIPQIYDHHVCVE
jgi:hypothetical protein